eukprot:TRINITY_DN51052_c0_g1_i1.p1 TRINITY_DN51052_c0_g1~~TRINITY_DN51052_c0_g1_i1.p1  ORF type:complete len:474 (+),score=124.92 TRINITY_DN51052_c0_g1_i1:181-1602(+)
MMYLLLSLVVASCGAAQAATSQLPKAHLASSSSALEQKGKWWAQVGDHIVHTPHRDSGLSSDVGDYYYLYGSHGALTEELKDKRVGGAGRLHIIHLPGGVDSLQEELPYKAGRRSAVSALVQLQHQDVLNDAKLFPSYSPSQGYKSPLSEAGEKLEEKVVALITEKGMMDKLKEVTTLGDGSEVTRSWENKKATEEAISFIQDQFKEMKYEVCQEKLSNGQVNVVAHVKGSDKGEGGSVVLGGHYDSRPFSGAAPGAVDNGSGAAAVLAIARAFAEAKIKPKRSIYFVAFAAEEPGLLGSEEFSSRLADSSGSSFLEVDKDASLSSSLCGDKPEALLQENNVQKRRNKASKKHEALVLDEIAWKSPNIADGSYIVNLESYDWAKDVLDNLAGSSMKHNGDKLKVTHSNKPFGSDHMSFLEKKFEAVLSIHGDDEEYKGYHTSHDTIDQVNPELYTMIVKMNAGALVRLAGIAA